MRIKKARYKKGKVTVTYEEQVTRDDETFTNTVTKESNIEPHEDLPKALHKLSEHLALITEQINDLYDPGAGRVIAGIRVYQISLSGYDEHEGAVLCGTKTLRGDRKINLVSPFVKFEDEHEEYQFQAEFASNVDEAVKQFEAYVNGKYAPEKQMELEGVE